MKNGKPPAAQDSSMTKAASKVTLHRRLPFHHSHSEPGTHIGAHKLSNVTAWTQVLSAHTQCAETHDTVISTRIKKKEQAPPNAQLDEPHINAFTSGNLCPQRLRRGPSAMHPIRGPSDSCFPRGPGCTVCTSSTRAWGDQRSAYLAANRHCV